MIKLINLVNEHVVKPKKTYEFKIGDEIYIKSPGASQRLILDRRPGMPSDSDLGNQKIHLPDLNPKYTIRFNRNVFTTRLLYKRLTYMGYDESDDQSPWYLLYCPMLEPGLAIWTPQRFLTYEKT